MNGLKTCVCVVLVLLAGGGCIRQQQRRDCVALLMQSTVKEIKVASYPSFLETAIEKQEAAYKALEDCTGEAQLRQAWPEIRAIEVELRDRTLEYAELFYEEGVLAHAYMLKKIVEDLNEVIEVGDLDAWDDDEVVSATIMPLMNRIPRDYQMLLLTLTDEGDFCNP